MKQIIVDGVTKKFDIFPEDRLRLNFREKMSSFLTKPINSETQKKRIFTALNNISFSVNEGDVFGILGNNGSGKSTLLRMICRITAPSLGKITVRGKIAALLEMGAGFHSDLSGRENLLLNGVTLGRSYAEIKQVFDEIVSFSELEDFIDIPIKRYSSGMRLRLAFSVFVYLVPEIFLLDEVLAVGDFNFQKKCFAKINELKDSGRTIVLVSHQVDVIKNMCNRGIILEHGNLVQEGLISDILPTYINKQTQSTLTEQRTYV